jgi:hypothetical protein
MGGGGETKPTQAGFGLVNSTIQTIWKSRTKIISAFEQNGTKIKRFRKPDRSDVD